VLVDPLGPACAFVVGVPGAAVVLASATPAPLVGAVSPEATAVVAAALGGTALVLTRTSTALDAGSLGFLRMKNAATRIAATPTKADALRAQAGTSGANATRPSSTVGAAPSGVTVISIGSGTPRPTRGDAGELTILTRRAAPAASSKGRGSCRTWSWSSGSDALIDTIVGLLPTFAMCSRCRARPRPRASRGSSDVDIMGAAPSETVPSATA
jgi:hypothetical protein